MATENAKSTNQNPCPLINSKRITLPKHSHLAPSRRAVSTQGDLSKWQEPDHHLAASISLTDNLKTLNPILCSYP